LRPKSPQHEAGIRIDPPPSPPPAIGTIARSATGATGCTVDVPWISARAPQLGFAERYESELWEVGLPEDGDAGLAKTFDQFRVVLGDEPRGEAARTRRRVTRVAAVKVLCQKGYTGEHRLAIHALSGRARVLLHEANHGVQRGIQLLEAREGDIEQLHGCHVPGSDGRGQAGRVQPDVFVVGHRASRFISGSTVVLESPRDVR
jgi:hypothetical protein